MPALENVLSMVPMAEDLGVPKTIQLPLLGSAQLPERTFAGFQNGAILAVRRSLPN